MALPSSQLSFSQINTALGFSSNARLQLSSCYAFNGNIPSSGMIQISQFKGQSHTNPAYKYGIFILNTNTSSFSTTPYIIPTSYWTTMSSNISSAFSIDSNGRINISSPGVYTISVCAIFNTAATNIMRLLPYTSSVYGVSNNTNDITNPLFINESNETQFNNYNTNCNDSYTGYFASGDIAQLDFSSSTSNTLGSNQTLLTIQFFGKNDNGLPNYYSQYKCSTGITMTTAWSFYRPNNSQWTSIQSSLPSGVTTSAFIADSTGVVTFPQAGIYSIFLSAQLNGTNYSRCALIPYYSSTYSANNSPNWAWYLAVAWDPYTSLKYTGYFNAGDKVIPQYSFGAAGAVLNINGQNANMSIIYYGNQGSSTNIPYYAQFYINTGSYSGTTGNGTLLPRSAWNTKYSNVPGGFTTSTLIDSNGRLYFPWTGIYKFSVFVQFNNNSYDYIQVVPYKSTIFNVNNTRSSTSLIRSSRTQEEYTGYFNAILYTVIYFGTGNIS